MGKPSNNRALLPFVPRLILDWRQDRPEDLWMELDASMLLADVSGFTRMSERLSRQGRIGAEEVTEVIGNTFGTLLSEAYSFGGSLLKFGGDALLLLFSDHGHPARAAAAAHGMRAKLREIGTFTTTAGKVTLRMSVAAHTGKFHFFLVGDSHRELIVAGPGASTLVEIQDAASAGQILLSPATSESLPVRNRGRTVGPGVLLSRQVEAERSEVIVATSDMDLTPFIPNALRETVLEGESEPEHRPVTVAFIHYSHFDELVTDSGPDVAAKALDGLVRSVQRAVSARGVAFLATDIAPDGGKIILTAGAPTVTGADEELMLLALREVVSAEHTIPIEIGVHQGYVFSGEIGTYYRRTYTVMGDTVNLAARLMAKASPGQILTTPEVLVGSRTLFETTQLEPFHVKGKKRPVPALSVGEPKGSRAAISEAGLPLVGRDEELRALLEGWESTRAGSGRVVELRAEAGMGKSRLLEEFLSGVEGATPLASECRLYQSTTPYFPFRSLLRQAFGLEDLDERQTVAGLEKLVKARAPDLLPWLSLLAVPLDVFVPESRESAMLEDEFRRTRLEEALESLLTASLTEPTVITIEDTHWMDEASRELLGRLAHSIGQRPWMMVFSRRPGDGGFVVGDDLVALSRLDLRPLGTEQAADLINTATKDTPLMPHQVQALAERAQGNPLFLIELLDALRSGEDVEAMPHSVEGLIRARIDRLPPADRTLLRYVSVLGTGFHTEHASAVLPGTDGSDPHRALRRLTDFLGIQRNGWVQFRHGLIRDAAYEGLPYRTRQQLHAQVADSILQAAGSSPEDQAELLSLHYYKAKRWEKAWTYSRIAGDNAKAIYANVEAAAIYERALESGRHVEGASDRDRADVLTRLGDVRELSGSFEGAFVAYRRASRLVGDDPLARGQLHLKRARARERAGAFTAAMRETTLGSKLVSEIDSQEAAGLKALLTSFRAIIRQGQQRPDEAMRQSRLAIEQAEGADQKEALARAYTVLSWSTRHLGLPGADEYDRAALRLFEELGDYRGQAFATGNLGYEYYFLGRWDEALKHYAEAELAFEKSGDVVLAAALSGNIGEVLVSQRRFEEADPFIRGAIQTLKAAGMADWAAEAEIRMGRLYAGRGDLERAEQLFLRIREDMTSRGLVANALEASIYLAECWIEMGRVTEALELLEDSASEAGDEVAVFEAPLARVRAAAHLRLGSLDDAEHSLRLGLEEAQRQQMPYELALLLLTQAEIDHVLGRDGDEASAEAERLLKGLGVRIPTAAAG